MRENRAAVPAADGRHVYDLSVEQLHSGVLTEDANLAHAVPFLDGELVTAGHDRNATEGERHPNGARGGQEVP